MTYYKCENCGALCDLVEVDHGGYEEVWGARMWRPEWGTVSDCCHAEYEEVGDPEKDWYDTTKE